MQYILDSDLRINNLVYIFTDKVVVRCDLSLNFHVTIAVHVFARNLTYLFNISGPREVAR